MNNEEIKKIMDKIDELVNKYKNDLSIKKIDIIDEFKKYLNIPTIMPHNEHILIDTSNLNNKYESYINKLREELTNIR